MSKDTVLFITIIRHGRTSYNKKEIFQGKLDIPLDEVGLKQAKHAGMALKDEYFDCVYSSDISRTLSTASEIISQNVVSNKERLGVKRDPLLRDRDYGVMEGRPWSDWKKAANAEGLFGEEEINKFLPKDGEDENDVFNRGKLFLNNICKDFRDVSDLVPCRNNYFRVLIVSHSINITQMIKYLVSEHNFTGIPEAELKYILKTSNVPNTGISKFELYLNSNGAIDSVLCSALCSEKHLINM